MKALILLIVVAALLLALRQGQESARLAVREKELLANRPASHGNASDVASRLSRDALPTKTGRTEGAGFDAKLYFEKLRKLALNPSAATEEDVAFLQTDLLNASTADILELHALLGRSQVPQGAACLIYECVAPRLLDTDPALASEFAVKGADIRNFILIMRSWIARDPVAAGEWLAAKSEAEPPLGERTFAAIASHPEPLDVPGLRLAASIAAAPASADLSPLLQLDGPKLQATMDHFVKAIPRDAVPALLKRLSDRGRHDLIEMTLARYPEPGLAREYLASAGLPPAEFMKAAVTHVAKLDPAGMIRGLDWFLTSTPPETRAEGLREIVTKWTTENPRSASAWIGKLPNGTDRELAEQAFAAASDASREKALSGSH